jgi:NADH:ubiquinone reductase (H+-translocating)
VKRYPLAGLFRGTGVHIVGGRVTEIDPEGGEVLVETGAGTSCLALDRLVYALGSTSDTSSVPGAREHAFVLDSTSTAEDLRRALEAAASSCPVATPGGRRQWAGATTGSDPPGTHET